MLRTQDQKPVLSGRRKVSGVGVLCPMVFFGIAVSSLGTLLFEMSVALYFAQYPLLPLSQPFDDILLLSPQGSIGKGFKYLLNSL